MATNIEQIFRSFVVSKFREIQQELSRYALPSLFCPQGTDRAPRSPPWHLYSEAPSFLASGPAMAPPGPGIHFPPPPPIRSLPGAELRLFCRNPDSSPRTGLRRSLSPPVCSSPSLSRPRAWLCGGGGLVPLGLLLRRRVPLPLSASVDFAGRCPRPERVSTGRFWSKLKSALSCFRPSRGRESSN